MKNNLFRIIFLLSILTFCLAETGMVMRKGESGIGMWGSITKGLDCSSCDATRSLTFDYLTPLGIQISYSIMGDNRATQLAYYLKANNNNLSFRYNVTDYDHFDYDPVLLGVRWFNISGLTIEVSNYSYDYTNYEIVESAYWCYDGWSDWYYDSYNPEYECSYDEWVNHNSYDHKMDNYGYVYRNVYHNYISIGKYVKTNSFVIGVEYTNQLENFDDLDSGSISFKIGTLF